MTSKQTVLAAVSGGPDSMALLDWLNRQGFSVVIAHVNYQKRKTADRDEKIVRQWARAHRQPLWILHPRQEEPGNFQAWARQVRYAFFEAVALGCGIESIYLGHHQDDHLETWMLQKARQSLPAHYGLETVTPWRCGLKLVRPLLSRSKKELETLCLKKGIEYGIDESNLDNLYQRNRLRHTWIEPAGADQRSQWLKWIELDNASLNAMRSHAAFLLEKAFQGEAQMLFEDPLSLGWLALETLVHEKSGRHLSRKAALDLLEKLRSGSLQKTGAVRLQILFGDADHPLNGHLAIRNDTVVPFYIEDCWMLEKMAESSFCYGPYSIARSGKTIESFAVKDDDFPLIIRPAKAGDAIAARYGTKKISRLHIDRHIPAIFRDRFPVIEGRNGLLFASLAGCDPNHYNPVENRRFYMVELPV